MFTSTVKNFSVRYNSNNESNSFTSGDYVKGQIILEVAKHCKIHSLSIKMKGKAEVRWSETQQTYGGYHQGGYQGQGNNTNTRTYYAKNKYFSIKQWMIQEHDKSKVQDQQTLMGEDGQPYSNEVATGTHVYPFTFRIPQQDMPSSFKGIYGKVLYTLTGTLSRSMRANKNSHAELDFVSTFNMLMLIPGLMAPQHGTKGKEGGFFSSGQVHMDVHLERMGYYQGEGINVVISVDNRSSKEIKTKFSLSEQHIYIAQGNTKLYSKEVLKAMGQPIPPSSNQTVASVIPIPVDLYPSILNCQILKAGYILKVYLDIPMASDPEVNFPVVILPAQAKGQQPGPQPWQQPALQPGQQAWQQPGQQAWQQPGQQSWQQPGQQPWQQPGQQPWQQPGQQPWQQPGQQPWQQPGQQPPPPPYASALQFPTAPPGAYPSPPAYGIYPPPSDFGSDVKEEK